MPGRKGNGEGSIDRHHGHPTCPPVDGDGKRPKHRCQGPYRARATVTVEGRKVRRTVYGATKEAVVAKLRQLQVDDHQGALVASTKVPTVGEWLQAWYASAAPGWKVNYRKCVGQRMHTWLIPHLGHQRLDRLTPVQVEGMYAAMRAAGRAEGTVRQCHVNLARAYRVAVRQGVVARNVMERVEPPTTEQSSRNVMPPQAAKLVLAAAGDDPRPYVALLCGLRQGEALALRWCDLDLDAPEPYLVVRRSVCRQPGEGLVFTTPKSKASRNRVVPLLPEVVARLRVQRAKHLANGWDDPEGLVFCTSKRTPYSSTQDRLNWDRVLERAGVGRYTLHSARNVCAHLLEDAGVLPRVVADLLGHSTVAMTYRYQEGNTTAKLAAMGALGAHLALPPDAMGTLALGA